MDIINVAPAYPNANLHQLIPSLLEHEGHHLTVHRNSGGGDGISPELWLQCEEKRCEDNMAIIVMALPRVANSITLTVNVRSWFAVDMPDADELAHAINDGLHKDFHSPDEGEWWIDGIVYGDGI